MTRDICMFCGIQRTQGRCCVTQKIAAEAWLEQFKASAPAPSK